MFLSVSSISAQEMDNDVLSIEDSPISEDISDIGAIEENSISEDISDVDNQDIISSNTKSKSTLSDTLESDTLEDDMDLSDGSEVYTEDNIKAKLKASKLTTTFKSGKYFTFKAVESGTNNPISYASLKLRVYTGKKYKDYYIDTNKKGIAKFKTSSLSVGTHKVIISDVDDSIDSSSIKSSIKINKAKTITKASKLTTKYKKKSYFKITIKNKATKKTISGLKLKIKVYTGKKYKVYKVKTNSKGVAKFKTNKLKVGTHKVVISSANKNYVVKSKSSIVIKKAKKKTTKKSGGSYVGSVNSDVFHYSSCASAKRIKSYNKVTFSSRSNALNSGYRPCAKCHP